MPLLPKFIPCTNLMDICQKPQRGTGAVAVRVVYVYCHGYCGVQGYSDRGVLVQWQYAWCTYTATVTVEYRDTLTEGYWCSGSTRGVRVLPRLLWSTGIL